MTATSSLPEDNRYLAVVAAAPAVWFAHFLLVYVGPAVWCARLGGTNGALAPVRPGIIAATVIALVVIAVVAVSGYRRHRHGGERLPHDLDSAEDRHRFLGFATLLLASLSAVATVAVAAAVLVFDSCRP